MKPDRFEDGRAMLLAGSRVTHKMAEAHQTIPAQWAVFNAARPPSPARDVTYGVICGSNGAAGTMEYMCGIEVESFDGLAEDTGRMRIAPQHYAVFHYDGHVSGIGQFWMRIFNVWLPASGYQSAEKPDFERYDSRYDPATGEGGLEIWVGVRN